MPNTYTSICTPLMAYGLRPTKSVTKIKINTLTANYEITRRLRSVLAPQTNVKKIQLTF